MNVHGWGEVIAAALCIALLIWITWQDHNDEGTPA